MDSIVVYNLDYGEYEKNGKTHLDIKKDHLDVFPAKFSIHLDNLFNGNKALGMLGGN